MRCKFCDEDHLEVRQEIRKVEIKGKEVEYLAEYYYCPELDIEFETGELLNINLNRARDAYREYVGLLTTTEIVKIREKLKLSQKELSTLLGMKESTISEIESKVIQDKNCDDSIRRIVNNPLFLLKNRTR